jgi:CBS domain-containing protein
MIRAPRTVKPAPTMDDTIAKKSRHPMRRVLDVLAGFHLASVLILLLGILTWLGTLEQVDMGLFEVKKKYFSASTFWVVPKYNGYTVPLILPNAYWVGMLFFLNLSLGTIFKARWRPATMGILIAHFGILFLLLGAFVTQHFSKRGNMAITEGETSDVAQDYFDHVIEVTELVDGKPAKVNVVETKYLSDLDPEDTRLFRMENLPFDLKVQEYRVNARPVSTAEKPAQPGSAVVDGSAGACGGCGAQSGCLSAGGVGQEGRVVGCVFAVDCEFLSRHGSGGRQDVCDTDREEQLEDAVQGAPDEVHARVSPGDDAAEAV